MTDKFQVPVLPGVRQGCMLSPFLFLMAIDLVLKKTTEDRKNCSQLAILENFDDLALISHKHSQIQTKTAIFGSVQTSVGLRIEEKSHANQYQQL